MNDDDLNYHSPIWMIDEENGASDDFEKSLDCENDCENTVFRLFHVFLPFYFVLLLTPRLRLYLELSMLSMLSMLSILFYHSDLRRT